MAKHNPHLLLLISLTALLVPPAFCQEQQPAQTPDHTIASDSHDIAPQADPDQQQPDGEASHDQTARSAQTIEQTSDEDGEPTDLDKVDEPVVKQLQKRQKTGQNNPSQKGSTKKARPRSADFESEDLPMRIQEWFLTSGLHLALIAILAIAGLKFTHVFSQNAFDFFMRHKEGTELKRRADTLSSVVRYSLSVSIIAISAMMGLKELGIDIGPILAGAGVVGLAIGFGAQNLVKDIISGSFILLEDQIRVGDVVKVGDKSGVVEKVTLRMVVLRDLSYNVHYIPNSEIHIVTNMTKTYSGYLFDIGVAYRENVDEVIEMMRNIDRELRVDPEYSDRILEPLEVLGLQEFADSSVIIRARTKTIPLQQWRVGREFNRRLKKLFDDRGIEIPFPHLTVYPGEHKDGNAASFNFNVQSGN